MFDNLPKTYLNIENEISLVVESPMKTHKKTLVVFLLIFSLLLVYFFPVVLVLGGNSTGNITDQGDSSGDPQRDSADTTNQTGDSNGQQGDGNSQNSSGQQGEPIQDQYNGYQYHYRYQRRNTIMDGAGNYTRIRSKCRNNTANEAFEIFFTIDNAPTLKLSYIPTLNASASEDQRHFIFSIKQLIEYNDINTNGKYDQNDVIISSLLMKNITFTNITYTNITTLDGKTVTTIETHTINNVFSITIYLVSEKTLFLQNTITPKEIKIDFKIINYPFLNQTSQLALITEIKSPYGIKTEETTYDEEQGLSNHESGLNISSSFHSGFFTWANNAIVDNSTYIINTTVISEIEHTFFGNTQESFTQTQVIFSYPRGEVILHDPKIGVIDFLGDVSAIIQLEFLSAIYLVACLFSGVIFYGIIYFRKKR